jgi:hypothetical protein
MSQPNEFIPITRPSGPELAPVASPLSDTRENIKGLPELPTTDIKSLGNFLFLKKFKLYINFIKQLLWIKMIY